MFTMLQITKILKYMNMNYSMLIDKNIDRYIKENLYKEQTHVFCYYILKGLLLFYNNDTIHFFKKNNTSLLTGLRGFPLASIRLFPIELGICTLSTAFFSSDRACFHGFQTCFRQPLRYLREKGDLFEFERLQYPRVNLSEALFYFLDTFFGTERGHHTRIH